MSAWTFWWLMTKTRFWGRLALFLQKLERRDIVGRWQRRCSWNASAAYGPIHKHIRDLKRLDAGCAPDCSRENIPHPGEKCWTYEDSKTLLRAAGYKL